MSNLQRGFRALLIAVALVVFIAPGTGRAQDAVPRFEPSDCWFDVPADQTVECGYVVVPELHANPDGPTIKLAVAVFKALGDQPQPDPVMMLSGGPGEKALENAVVVAGMLAPVFPDRDFITFDQRGVGNSEPSLECPEWRETFMASMDSPDPNLDKEYNALIACSDRLAEEGINFAAFNTTENAADVADIQAALGYEQVNLFGASYGSLLAQVTMRDHPEGIRSVILDSVLPTGASVLVDSSVTTEDALTRLVDACAADEACNTTYPDLQQVLFDTIDRLNAEPVSLTIQNPLTGESYDVLMTGDAMLGNLMFFLYQTSVLPVLPQAIYDVYNGDYALMTQLSGTFLVAIDALTRGMQYTVSCTEDLVGRTPEQYLEILADLPPQYRGRADIEDMIEYGPFGICAGWPVEEVDPAFKEPVVSDLPSLVLAGQFDPVTPPRYAQQVADTLSSSYSYEFPGVGHSVLLGSTCAQEIAQDFVQDPTTEPDVSCITDLGLKFVVPQTSFTLVPFTSDIFGITGVIPDNWSELSPGTYAESAVSETALIQQSLSGDIATITDLLKTQLGLAEFPASTGTREANGLTWELYEVEIQGYPTRLAVTTSEGTALLVMLISSADEIEKYTELVFLPAVDALQPTR